MEGAELSADLSHAEPSERMASETSRDLKRPSLGLAQSSGFCVGVLYRTAETSGGKG